MVVGNAGADRHARLTGVSVWVTRAAPWPLPQAQGETGACSPGHALGYRSAREVRQDLRGNPLILRGHLWCARLVTVSFTYMRSEADCV